jgi:hypothetical protein
MLQRYVKKALIVVVAIALVVWVASWFWNEEAVRTAASRPWPTAASRLPVQHANEASVKLTALAKALPRNEAVDAFVSHEIARGNLTIGKPPALPDVTMIRELLLHEPVVWQRRAGIGGGDETEERRKTVLVAARALVAGALSKGRANDRAAWDDLRATWNLARSLDGHPQMMMQTAALTMARMINAVAWKMPLPVPTWFAEVRERDNIRPLLESFQFQTASYVESGTRIFPTRMLANSIDHDRSIAEEVANTTRCDVNIPMNEVGVDLSFVWRRAFRYRAEREGTANALRVRQGRPIESHSRCIDGGWTFDGTTLRFSHDIVTAPSGKAIPLTMQLRPRPGP